MSDSLHCHSKYWLDQRTTSIEYISDTGLGQRVNFQVKWNKITAFKELVV